MQRHPARVYASSEKRAGLTFHKLRALVQDLGSIKNIAGRIRALSQPISSPSSGDPTNSTALRQLSQLRKPRKEKWPAPSPSRCSAEPRPPSAARSSIIDVRLSSLPHSNGETVRVKFRIYPDGRVEETVSGIRGSDCTKVTEELNEKLGKVTQTKPTSGVEVHVPEVQVRTGPIRPACAAAGAGIAVRSPNHQPAKSPSLIRRSVRSRPPSRPAPWGRLDDGRLLH